MSTFDPLLSLGIILALAALLGAWASYFRLPLLVAYILAGVILGPLVIGGGDKTNFSLLRDLGLSLLLFLVGLEIKIDELRNFGKQSLVVGLAQILLTSFVGFFLSIGLGFSTTSALYIALALTFSSTVIVVKLLTEKRDFDSLYGKLAVAILLLQDLLAIFVLILIPALGGNSGFKLSKLLLTVLVGLVLVSIIYWLSRRLLPHLFDRLARNLELLFLTSLAYLILISAISAKLGFSLEIGAFLAGLGLASLKEEHQIAARIRPLRDFFIVIFFIILGTELAFDFTFSTIAIALTFSLFVLVAKPLIVLFVFGRLGFQRRTGFMVGLTLAQVSEFSLIIMFLGLKQGIIPENVVSVITLTAFITIATSSYLLVYATKIYRQVGKYFKLFERDGQKIEDNQPTVLENHVILVGCNRLGWEILKQLQKQGKPVLVVDFNPTVIKALEKTNVEYLFGDITDPEIWVLANADRAEIIISTIFDPQDTLELLETIKKSSSGTIIFVTAAERNWAVKFYSAGADYVIVPRILSGHQVAHLLTAAKLSEIKEGKYKKEHLEELHEALNKLAL